jgi:hypothetical protein
MKLNLNPKEFLSLYNILRDATAGNGTIQSEDEKQVQQLYNRLRACLISSLSKEGPIGSDSELFARWQEKEAEKIAILRAQYEKQHEDKDLDDTRDLIDEFSTEDDGHREYPKRVSVQKGDKGKRR